MKFKILTICLTAIFLLGAGSSEIQAQRKETKKASTTSTKAATTPKGPALNCEDLTYCDYLAWTDLNSENGLFTHSVIRLNKYYFFWTGGANKDKFIGTWGISGNKLNLKSTSSANLIYNLESNNEGESFTGTVVNSAKNFKGAAYMYEVYEVDEPWTETDIKDFFKDGEAIGYINFEYKDLIFGIPVTVSFVYDEDSDKRGYIKLQSTAAAFPAMGITKIPFVIGETALSYTNKEGDEKSYNYDKIKNNYLAFTVGNAPHLGNCSLLLCLLQKPESNK